MRVALVGSRNFTDYTLFCKELEHEDITHIISGGANGTDYLAEVLAHDKNLPITVFRAEWEKYGKSAGYRRNVDIVEASDKVICFWDGQSKGSKHTIDIANKMGKPVRVIIVDKKE